MITFYLERAGMERRKFE